MKINIVCVGKIKEKYFVDAINEYSKRLSKYVTLAIKELKDEANISDIKKVQDLEGCRILENIKDGYNIGLVIKGTMLDSEELAEKISNIGIYQDSTINFVIGGSLGLSENVLSKMDFKLSFSKMTFPHQLMRVILLEQIYRAFKINNNESYHK
jgi:23S rRNA (pseudouridine1915-N3)-methyltransferase